MNRVMPLADAVAAHLNRAGGPIDAAGLNAAVREYDPTYDLESATADAQIQVIPRSNTLTLNSRAGLENDIAIDVGIQGRPTDQAARDAIIKLAEQIAADFFDAVFDLPNGDQAAWTGSEHEPLFAPEHLRQYGVLTTVITLNFRAA